MRSQPRFASSSSTNLWRVCIIFAPLGIIFAPLCRKLHPLSDFCTLKQFFAPLPFNLQKPPSHPRRLDDSFIVQFFFFVPQNRYFRQFLFYNCTKAALFCCFGAIFVCPFVCESRMHYFDTKKFSYINNSYADTRLLSYRLSAFEKTKTAKH